MNETLNPDKTETVSVMIVDDEAHARARIRQLLEHKQGVQVIGEAVDGFAAVELIQNLRPQIVFLDVQMPGRDGFEVLRLLGNNAPSIVFVTAFNEYAIKAFEFNAIDYVLKPIDRHRFENAVNRACQRIEQVKRDSTDDSTPAGNLDLDSDPSAIGQAGLIDGPSKSQRLLVKTQGVYRIVDVNQIQWIEAADKYVRLHTSDQVFTCRHTMRELETNLDQDLFVRVHRSSIVNIAAIAEIQPHFHGDFKIVLTDQTVLTLSRSYRPTFESKFHNKL